MSLKRKSTDSVIWSLMAKLAHQGYGLIISVFLARLLSPTEFGLVGMAVAFTGISSIFIEAGFVGALVQSNDNTSVTYSSVFYFNIFVGILLFFIFQAIAPLIANFYEEPDIEGIIRWLSVIPPIASLSLVQGAILQKQLKFKELTMRHFISGALAGAVSITMAFAGFGVYALVAQSIVSYIVMTVILWKVGDWSPKLEFDFSELRRLMPFSAYMFFTRVLNQMMRQSNVLVIGKLFSPATLGFFSKANSLNKIVTKYSSDSIVRVFFPAMSQLKNDKQQFMSVLVKTIGIISLIAFFISGWMAISAELLIITLFGEKWMPSVFIYHILVFRIYAGPINGILLNALVADGKAKENFWHGGVRKIGGISSIAVAFWLGFEAFLYAIVIFPFLSTIYNVVVVAKIFKVSPLLLAKEAMIDAAIFGLGMLPWLFLPIEHLFLRTLVGGICFSVIYLVLTERICNESFQRTKNLVFSYAHRFRQHRWVKRLVES